jgi:predicted DNA-binding protein
MPSNQIVFKCDPELKRLIQRLAAKQGRPVGNYIKWALTTYLKEHEGIDWEKAKAQPDKYD